MAQASMQRRHFELIAATIAEARTDCDCDPAMMDGLLVVTSRLAWAFATTNERFDRERFIKACGFNV